MKNKKLCTGPFGFPLTDAVAKAIDALLKTLPKECREYRRKAQLPDAVELVSGERADISMVSCETLDRDNEVILSKGIQLDLFRRNPIVTFAHKYDELPVGSCQWIKCVQGGVKAKSKYADRPDGWQGDWMADAVWSLTQQGILRGKSIGFIPTEISAPRSDEIKARPEWKNASAIVRSGVLLEYAVAPIPVNQDALVEAVAKGMADEKTLKRLGLDLPARKAMPVKKQVDTLAVFLKALNRIKIDPEAIAREVIETMQGRV